jgi:para-nitrobenzyl esterase
MTERQVVQTPSGALRGTPLPDGGVVFAGVPFAAPPRRLRPPEPLEPWPGVRDATRFRPAAAQRVSALISAPAPAFPGAGIWAPPAECDEDCLYLNVWTPDPAGRRPVLVWIHGGGFDSGAAAPPASDGAALSRLTGAVVVTVAYRLGALGYLHVGGGNFGLRDQAAALRWISENVEAFGGDPGNVTVAGQSAGAHSVGALLATPEAEGTFHRAILQSGHAERVVDAGVAGAIAADLLAALGTDDLTGVPVEEILAAQNGVVDADLGRRHRPGGRSWGPVVDGDVLPRSPMAAIAAGAAAGIDLLIGVNRDEMRLFQALQGPAYAPADEQALLAEMRGGGVLAPEELLSAYRDRAPGADLAALRTSYLTDAVYRWPAERLAAAQTAAGGRAYSYLFAAEPLGPAFGACHGAELAVLFGEVDAEPELGSAWARFVATGDPGWAPHETYRIGGLLAR